MTLMERFLIMVAHVAETHGSFGGDEMQAAGRIYGLDSDWIASRAETVLDVLTAQGSLEKQNGEWRKK